MYDFKMGRKRSRIPPFLFIFGVSTVLESQFQRKVIRDIQKIFVNAAVLKNDSSYIQGVPDLSIFYKDKWAMLECKANANAHHQPNQDYYISMFDKMGFARFIYPENEEEVLAEMILYFGKEE